MQYRCNIFPHRSDPTAHAGVESPYRRAIPAPSRHACGGGDLQLALQRRPVHAIVRVARRSVRALCVTGTSPRRAPHLRVDDRPRPAPPVRTIRGVISRDVPVHAARTRPRAVRAALLLLAVVLAAIAAGCGGSSKPASGSGANAGADPATVAPAGSAVFVSAITRPQGTAKANVERLGRAILAKDDFAGEVKRLLAMAGKDSPIDFQRDIEPWLGDRLAVAVPSLSGPAFDPLVIGSSTDDAKARDALGRAVKSPQDGSYRGVAYQHSADGRRAGAVVDHLAIYGSEENLKRAIDAAKGTALATNTAYTRALAKLPPDALATGYVDLRGLIAGAGKVAGNSAASGLLGSVLGKDIVGIGFGAYADADAVRVEFAVPGTGAVADSVAGGAAADALAAAPADAWLGIGLGNLGKTLSSALGALTASGGLGAIGTQALLGQAQQSLGLDIQRDLLSWMGSAHLFVSGTTADTVGGALVVHSTNPSATRHAVDKLAGALPPLLGGTPFSRIDSAGRTGFAIPLGKSVRATVVASGETFVIAIGDRALNTALGRGARLGGTAGFKAISAKLSGAKPVLYLDLGQVADLVEAVGGSGKDTQQAVAVLRRFTQLAAGGRNEDGVSRATIVAGVKVK